MKNDPYLRYIFATIALGLILAIVSTHVHAAVPLPPLHVTAEAPHWKQVIQARASQVAHRPADVPTPAVVAVAANAPAMPAPTAVDLHLGS